MAEARVSKTGSAENLASIRASLKLSVSDLAALLDVSRVMVYAWIEGHRPGAEDRFLIARLAKVASEVERRNIPRFEKLLKRPIIDGPSFFDHLKVPEQALACLPALKQLGDQEHSARSTCKGLSSTPRHDGYLEHTNPLYGSD